MIKTLIIYVHTSIRLSLRIGLPSWSHLTSWTGCPDTIHWNSASLSTSIVCICGCKWTVNGAVWENRLQFYWVFSQFAYAMTEAKTHAASTYSYNIRVYEIWCINSYPLLLMRLESFPRLRCCLPNTNIYRCLPAEPSLFHRRGSQHEKDKRWEQHSVNILHFHFYIRKEQRKATTQSCVIFIKFYNFVFLALRWGFLVKQYHFAWIIIPLHVKDINTLSIFNKPADTIVIRSLSCNGNNCSFSSLNHLFEYKRKIIIKKVMQEFFYFQAFRSNFWRIFAWILQSREKHRTIEDIEGMSSPVCWHWIALCDTRYSNLTIHHHMSSRLLFHIDARLHRSFWLGHYYSARVARCLHIT